MDNFINSKRVLAIGLIITAILVYLTMKICLGNWLVVLLGICSAIVILYLSRVKYLNNWIAFIFILAIIIYLLLLILGVCLNPWLLLIGGFLIAGSTIYLFLKGKTV